MISYWDHASTTYIYPQVVTEIRDMLEENWGNPNNLHDFGLKARIKVEEARRKIAKAIGADPGEIIFTSCASESNALAFNSVGSVGCSKYEHHDITVNPKVKVGESEGVEMFSQMLVNNETGEIFKLPKGREGVLLHSDMTQALGNIDINVHEMGVDMASFSFHKVHAPKGIGALYVRDGVEVKPMIWGAQEQHRRGGTENTAYIVAAGLATGFAVSEMKQKWEHCKKLREIITSGLYEKGVDFIVNEGEKNIPSILNVAFSGIEGEYLMLRLNDKGIYVSTGSACDSGNHEPSAVLSAMGVDGAYINGAIRISMSLHNTEEEAKALVENIKEIVG